MAECEYCAQEMTTAATCVVAVLHQDGEPVDLTPYRPSRRRGGPAPSGRERCGDCGVRPNGFHHPGCDLQRCPRCRRQFITCGCEFDEDGPLVEPIHLTVAPGTVLGESYGDGPVDRWFDDNGDPCERYWLGDCEVIVHYSDIPECDKDVVNGIPVTSALRTVIDIAPGVTDDHLKAMVRDCLERRLFTLDEAKSRLAEDDMRTRPGALRLRAVLPIFEPRA